MDEVKLVKKFEDLNDEWRAKIDSMSETDIKLMLAEIAKKENDNQQAKDEDEDLASVKEKYDTAKFVYTDLTKKHKLETRFCLWTLKSRGH